MSSFSSAPNCRTRVDVSSLKLSFCKIPLRRRNELRRSRTSRLRSVTHRSHIAALLLPRTLSGARRSGVVECQSVVLSSRRNIRLSFVPGHGNRAALSAFALRVTCPFRVVWVVQAIVGPAPHECRYLQLNGVRLDPLGLTAYPDFAKNEIFTTDKPVVVFFGDSRAADGQPGCHGC